jgi:hypothetical protein
LTLVVSNKAFEMAKKDAFSLAQETADKYKNEIKAELQGARITAETLATVFESLKENGLTDRKMMNDILRHALSKKEYITAFCIAYDPDALDGKDREYAGVTSEYDKTEGSLLTGTSWAAASPSSLSTTSISRTGTPFPKKRCTSTSRTRIPTRFRGTPSCWRASSFRSFTKASSSGSCPPTSSSTSCRK